jgi:hypothetical protein
VVDRSLPRGLDLAAVLRSQGVDDDRIRAWMQRQQERAFETAAARPAAAAQAARGFLPGRTSVSGRVRLD